MQKVLSNAPDKRVLAGLDRAEKLVLLVVAAVAGGNLALWFLPALARLLPSFWSVMTANTATGMLLAVAGLMFPVLRNGRGFDGFRRVAAALLFVLSGATLCEYALGVSLGIDQLLPHGHGGYPGRPAPQTAFTFLLISACLFCVRSTRRKVSSLADGLTLVLLGVLFVLLGGTIFDAQEVVGIHATNRVAPQTLLCFFCIAGLIARRRALAGSLFSVLVSIGIGSRMMRIVLPGAVFVPFALFALAGYMTRSSAIPMSYAFAIAAGAGSLILLCLVVWMAWRINAMERELRDLSLTDELTGVNNRRGFYLLARQVERDAARSGGDIAVIYFDMDGLKETNDTLGHDAGSEMIRRFTAVLTANLRVGDVIGRLGGDEFAVVTASTESGIVEILARMRQKLAELNGASELMIPIRFSAGYACRNAENPVSLDELVAQADENMYREKEAHRARRNGLAVVEPEADAVA